jgi:hypothetical protein
VGKSATWQGHSRTRDRIGWDAGIAAAWSRARRRDQSESSSLGDTDQRNPEKIKTLRGNVRSQGGQRPADGMTKTDAIAKWGQSVVAAEKRFSFADQK